MSAYLDSPGVHVGPDPDYSTQVNYEQKAPCLIKCEPAEIGPDADVKTSGRLSPSACSTCCWISTERERRTLGSAPRAVDVIAPWTAENPLMFHKTDSDPATIRTAIEQAHEAGFEMIIMSFGSGFNFESTDPNYVATYKQLADEARAKGLALGGYSLLASRGVRARRITPRVSRRGLGDALASWFAVGA